MMKLNWVNKTRVVLFESEGDFYWGEIVTHNHHSKWNMFAFTSWIVTPELRVIISEWFLFKFFMKNDFLIVCWPDDYSNGLPMLFYSVDYIRIFWPSINFPFCHIIFCSSRQMKLYLVDWASKNLLNKYEMRMDFIIWRYILVRGTIYLKIVVLLFISYHIPNYEILWRLSSLFLKRMLLFF